ncbi:MAG: roadblock/LC7 domain-containing protein [Thermoplasmata archaeon]
MLDSNSLKELGIEGYATVRKDGLLSDSILPEYIDKETFSIMVATIYMGSVSAYNELHLKGPETVILRGMERNIILLQKDAKEIYALIIPIEVNMDEALKGFLEKVK